MKEIENFFWDLCPNMAKNVVFGHFSAPWATPFTQNLIFSLDIVGRTPGDTHWGFLSLYITIRKFVLCFIKKMQKMGHLNLMIKSLLWSMHKSGGLFIPIGAIHSKTLLNLFLEVDGHF